MGPERRVLVLGSVEVDDLLTPASCIKAVEEAFRARGMGADTPSGVLGLHRDDGGFHLKAAAAPGWRYFAAKLNANFPANPIRLGLPTIQGLVVLFDGMTGSPLALIDSIRITALRTAAASGVAARHLARHDAASLFIAGCGTQALPHIHAMSAVRAIDTIFLYDTEPGRADALAARLAGGCVRVYRCRTLEPARNADIIVTCTTSGLPFLHEEHVGAGAFVAAVGADNEHKQEIDPGLMGSARVVVDSREQCVTMGDTRGALAAGTMTREAIYADLGEIVAGKRPGRSSGDEVFIFDSTGVALEDVAVSGAVYEAALRVGRGVAVDLEGTVHTGDPSRSAKRRR